MHIEKLEEVTLSISKRVIIIIIIIIIIYFFGNRTFGKEKIRKAIKNKE